MVHHLYYEYGKEPWEYPLEAFVTLCETCHLIESEERPKAEKTLIETLRKGRACADEIVDLARGIWFVLQRKEHATWAMMLEYFLEDEDRFIKLMDEFWDAVQKRKKHDP